MTIEYILLRGSLFNGFLRSSSNHSHVMLQLIKKGVRYQPEDIEFSLEFDDLLDQAQSSLDLMPPTSIMCILQPDDSFGKDFWH